MNSIFNYYAAYYDHFYKDKKYIKETKYIVNILHNNNIFKGSILDFGCGTGTHAILLNKYNYKVLGIDSSSKMISIANNKAKILNYKNLKFKNGDIKIINIKQKFNAIVSLFHVFSYQTKTTDVKDYFENANKHLHKKGILIFDFWYGPGILLSKQVKREKKLKIKNNIYKRVSNSKINFSENLVNVNIKINTLIKNKSKNLINENHEMRYFFLPEIEYYLNNSGFELINAFKSFKKSTPTINDWNAIVIAKKNK